MSNGLSDLSISMVNDTPKTWEKQKFLNIWQYVFPSERISKDPRSNKMRRHHIHESSLHRSVRQAVRKVNIMKPASPHTFTPLPPIF